MKYYVSVTEVLKRIVSVEASSESEATQKVKDAYAENKIVLDSDDFVEDSAEFHVPFWEQIECRNDEEEGNVEYQHID